MVEYLLFNTFKIDWIKNKNKKATQREIVFPISWYRLLHYLTESQKLEFETPCVSGISLLPILDILYN